MHAWGITARRASAMRVSAARASATLCGRPVSRLADLWDRAYASGEDGEVERRVAGEYTTLYKANHYSTMGHELDAESCLWLLSVLNLSRDDRFCDLGSSLGRLPLAVALLTPACSVAGVELSPSRHALALRAQHRLMVADCADAALAERLTFQQGDLVDGGTQLPESTVVWCAVGACKMASA